jgi:MFS transporter, CP family, cyanate transporter
MALSVGYLLAAAGPFLTGWLRAASGGYAAPFLALAFLCCAMLPVTLRLRPSSRAPGGGAIVPRPHA